ncbi:hypothetical protein R1flu_012394 [Riccia fluitans]|uniref:Uncharacterized protein n=1 Tax=Riccia fluitans TaxID=41844 RepID=A0ABD1ZEM3_9MARC
MSLRLSDRIGRETFAGLIFAEEALCSFEDSATRCCKSFRNWRSTNYQHADSKSSSYFRCHHLDTMVGSEGQQRDMDVLQHWLP